jgi:hypothetical protein
VKLSRRRPTRIFLDLLFYSSTTAWQHVGSGNPSQGLLAFERMFSRRAKKSNGPDMTLRQPVPIKLQNSAGQVDAPMSRALDSRAESRQLGAGAVGAKIECLHGLGRVAEWFKAAVLKNDLRLSQFVLKTLVMPVFKGQHRR